MTFRGLIKLLHQALQLWWRHRLRHRHHQWRHIYTYSVYITSDVVFLSRSTTYFETTPTDCLLRMDFDRHLVSIGSGNGAHSKMSWFSKKYAVSAKLVESAKTSGDDSAKYAQSAKMCPLSKKKLIQQRCAVSIQLAESAKKILVMTQHIWCVKNLMSQQ